MARIRTAFVSGTTLNNPLAIGDVTLSSAALSSLAAVTSPDTAMIVLDPAGVNGTPEVVTVTAHTAAATTATITRASETSTARAHPVGTTWVHGATTYDFLQGPQIVGSNAAEVTTVSTSAVDLLTISNLNIPVTSGIRIQGVVRKTAGAASFAALGLKLNSTVTCEADHTAAVAAVIFLSSNTNGAEAGSFTIDILPRSANYVAGIGNCIQTTRTSGAYATVFSNPFFSATAPNATITSLAIRGITASASQTLAVRDLVVYEIKYALGL